MVHNLVLQLSSHKYCPFADSDFLCIYSQEAYFVLVMCVYICHQSGGIDLKLEMKEQFSGAYSKFNIMGLLGAENLLSDYTFN